MEEKKKRGKPKKRAICPICGIELSKAGMNGHIRFKHRGIAFTKAGLRAKEPPPPVRKDELRTYPSIQHSVFQEYGKLNLSEDETVEFFSKRWHTEEDAPKGVNMVYIFDNEFHNSIDRLRQAHPVLCERLEQLGGRCPIHLRLRQRSY